MLTGNTAAAVAEKLEQALGLLAEARLLCVEAGARGITSMIDSSRDELDSAKWHALAAVRDAKTSATKV
jgi:hypothetical protein